MKTLKARITQRMAGALKPRKPVVVAMSGRGGAGSHRASRKAERQAARKDLRKRLVGEE